MKKFSQVFLLLAAVMLAASFFAACGSPTSENGGVSYTFTIDGLTAGNIDIQQGGSADIGRTLTASDDSSTAGITFTYVCGDADSGITVNAAGSLISVAADAVTGVHNFTVSAIKNGKKVATAQFTVTVIEADWVLTLYAPESVSQGAADIEVIQYELSAPHNDTTGVTFEISACQEGYTDLEVTYNETRDRFEIAPIPSTAQIGAHTYTIDVLKDGKVEATADLVINVIPQYTLTPSQSQYEAVRGSTLTIQYTLTASDGSSTDGLTVGFWCTSDYDACDLLPGHEDDWTNMTIDVPATAELSKVHSIQMEAQDADFQTLAVCNFTIKVVAPSVPAVAVTPGPAVNAAATDTSASVTFTAASAVSGLTSADFALSGTGAAFAATNPVQISGTTITVNVTIPANTASTVNTYTVGVSPTSTLISGSGTVAITQAAVAAATTYSLDVVITLGPDAPLLAGEVIWLGGDFFGSDWGKTGGTFVLTEQGDGTWTTTVTNIPIAKTTVDYNLYVDTSSTVLSWGPKASSDDLVLNNANTVGTLAYTVTKWLRPEVIADNLLSNPTLDYAADLGDDWKLSDMPGNWVFTGLLPALDQAWLVGKNPAPRSTPSCFTDWGWYNNSTQSLIGNGNTLKITQEVAASSNGLSSGTSVTLSVWIYRINTDQKAVKLLVGAQEYDATSDFAIIDDWQQISHTFTLTASDIVSDNVNVGLEYTAASANCQTGVDDFVFVKSN